ncbi:hypothetical protein [Sphingomonas immobilis]|uniref:Uncharacterized protein n=1 Tax=Sphingomonas immobilis TaxID=3063997 RepID=A0ABT8ZZ79_9SPHN|nr:hypothetical protein [Sphingomonas sp. CA1-15]MDO7842895.1 hypothetical protein [Sphingomonas sp. CA1-15]
MTAAKAWNAAQVRTWLERRLEASRLDQAAADKRGYSAQDDYDRAAAEEWVCRSFVKADCTSDPVAFAGRVKALLDQDDYRITGIYDDRRFEREVRTYLRKLAKMIKTNDGFEKTSRFQ